MICDMVTKPTGRARGRPPLPLREDPERHWIAHFYAACRLKPPEESDRTIALRTVAQRFGQTSVVSKTVDLLLDSGPETHRRYIYAGTDVRGVDGGNRTLVGTRPHFILGRTILYKLEASAHP